MNNPKVELIKIDGGGYYWVADDDVGGFMQSETYKTEEDAWRALFGNRVKWKRWGGDIGCPHKRIISLMSFGLDGRGRAGKYCADCGKEIFDEQKEKE